ncbi:hypothetical protein V2J09_019906 [Rumex salicifolius]
MAFEEFGQLSKRRRVEDAEKLKKRIVIIVIVFIVALLSVGGGILAYIHYINQNESNVGNGGGYRGKARGSSSDKMVTEVCAETDYKVKCEDTVAKVVKSQKQKGEEGVEPAAIVMASISAASNEFAQASKQTSTFKFETPDDKAAYNDCKVLFADALEELQASLGRSEQYSTGSAEDLRIWLSAVVSYQETCVDGFSDGSKTKTRMKAALNAAKAYLSNSLAIVANMPSLISKLSLQKHHPPPRLLRELTQKPNSEPPLPNVTVSKDGTGNFSTINQALLALPKSRQGRFYIYIKEGIYNEYVTVTKKMTNISMYGDGPQKTVITGSKNYADKVSTFRSATFAAIGEGFIAMNMGFKNTAGPEKHQAVALRAQADKSIFLNCRMEADEGTLYAQTHRQFYRDCVVIGRTDFIFGDAAAIFQNCTVLVRKPMESQKNVITAQARTCRYENTGFVLQGCRVVPDKDGRANSTYLGRPWKDFSRTIVMESTLENLIIPQGWLQAVDNNSTGGSRTRSTLYYAEFDNRGAGSNLTGRVKWPGYTNSLTKKQASGFTVTPFLRGSWIKDAGVPVKLGL